MNLLRKEDPGAVEAALKVASKLIADAADVDMAGIELAAVLLHMNNVYDLPEFEDHVRGFELVLKVE